MRFYGMLFFAIIFCAATCAPSARAQLSASITGVVTDPSGASVASAAISAKNLETGALRYSLTDDSGRYLVLSLPVAEYEVRVAKPGFQDGLRTGIHLVIGQEAQVDFRLLLKAMEMGLTVVADPPIVGTTANDISGLVGEQQVKQLPLNGRSYDLLLPLNPGIVNSTSQTTRAPAISNPPPPTHFPSSSNPPQPT